MSHVRLVTNCLVAKPFRVHSTDPETPPKTSVTEAFKMASVPNGLHWNEFTDTRGGTNTICWTELEMHQSHTIQKLVMGMCNRNPGEIPFVAMSS